MIEKILAVIQEVPSLKRGDRNAHGNYNYVSIDDYYATVAKIAAKNGLGWKAREVSSEVVAVGAKADRSGVIMDVLALKTKYEFGLMDAESGVIHDNFFSCTILHPLQGAQTAGSSLSYADKLFMRTVFKIVTGEGDADASDSGAFESFFDESAEKKPQRQAGKAKPEKVYVKIQDGGVTEHELDEDVRNIIQGLKEAKGYIEGDEAVKATVHEASVFIKDLVDKFLPVAESNEELVKFWAQNEHNFEIVKDENPETYKAIISAFKKRRKELSGGAS